MLLATLSPKSSAAEQVLTLGDSLTFAYEAEFGFRISVPFLGTYGDNFDSSVQNWVEILHSPDYRNAYFDQGERDDITLNLLFSSTNLFFRREYNWAVPGMKIDQLRRYLNQEVSLRDILAESPEFADLLTALDLSNYKDADFDVIDLAEQVENSAERLVLFIGGNDINQVYGDIYLNNAPGTFVQDYIDDATAIIDWIQTINPDLPIVVVNVPHVGITPDVQASYPSDPIKTEHVTQVLINLNQQLEQLCQLKDIAYADIFSITLPLLTNDKLCIHGITFSNSGSTTGELSHVWLNGPLSANFHPNTNAHTLIANQIIHAFNRHYQSGIPPLTATEMLVGLLNHSAADIDMPFDAWMNGFGLNGHPASDDSDHDGLNAGTEFALGLNPTFKDSEFYTQSIAGSTETPSWQLAYPVRLPSSSHYTLTPKTSSDLIHFTPLSPSTGSDGITRASHPILTGKAYLRLETIITP